jgi:FAD binding domain/Berberine and berberine like
MSSRKEHLLCYKEEHTGQSGRSTTMVVLEKAQIEALKASLRGELIQPGDGGYEAARKVYNGLIDKRPALIARCADVTDVIAAVNFGRENGLLVSIRGGGHNAGGLGICDDGLVIDLSLIRYTRVDPATRTVWVGGGSIWGDVDHATHAFGLAVPSGIISTTGVGGLTLGGGLGYLVRKCGLAIDNLIAADVVLADGRFVTADEQHHADLFWALRGGGGNFGVVTAFVFQAHPIHTVYGGPMLWELDQAPEVMRWYREFITQEPDDINGFFAFLIVPPGPPFPEHLHNKNMCGVVWCYTGPMEQAEETFKPIREKFPPALDFVGPIPQPALQSMFDALYPPGFQWYWKADFVNELSDEAIQLHIKHGSQIPTIFSTMHLYPVNGAARRVGKNDTAWSYRESTWAEVIVGVDPNPTNKYLIVDWARNYWDDLHPFSAGGAYVNFMMEEGDERVRASYRDNYERLVAIKSKYDPGNFFRVNQNIKPTM